MNLNPKRKTELERPEQGCEFGRRELSLCPATIPTYERPRKAS
jgi:hypothetical protein